MKNDFIFRFAYLSVANYTFHFSGLVDNTANKFHSENMNEKGQLRTFIQQKMSRCDVIREKAPI